MIDRLRGRKLFRYYLLISQTHFIIFFLLWLIFFCIKRNAALKRPQGTHQDLPWCRECTCGTVLSPSSKRLVLNIYSAVTQALSIINPRWYSIDKACWNYPNFSKVSFIFKWVVRCEKYQLFEFLLSDSFYIRKNVFGNIFTPKRSMRMWEGEIAG